MPSNFAPFNHNDVGHIASVGTARTAIPPIHARQHTYHVAGVSAETYVQGSLAQ